MASDTATSVLLPGTGSGVGEATVARFSRRPAKAGSIVPVMVTVRVAPGASAPNAHATSCSVRVQAAGVTVAICTVAGTASATVTASATPGPRFSICSV